MRPSQAQSEVAVRNPNQIVVAVGDNGVPLQITREKLSKYGQHLEYIGLVEDWEQIQETYAKRRAKAKMKTNYTVAPVEDSEVVYQERPNAPVEPVFTMGDAEIEPDSEVIEVAEVVETPEPEAPKEEEKPTPLKSRPGRKAKASTK